MANYWQKGMFIYNETTHAFLTNTSKTAESTSPHALISESIPRSFRWLGTTTNATPTEILGSGYIWTWLDVTELAQKIHFVCRNVAADGGHLYTAEILVSARSSANEVKTWRVTITFGYNSSNTFTIFNAIKEMLYN